MPEPVMQPLPPRAALPPEAMLARARAMREELQQRRTVRHFSDRPVAREVIEEAIRAAGTAPSGANRQPWHFVAVGDPELKRRIREAAEVEERAFYATAPAEWLAALAHLGTDEHKPYLEIAPWLIAVFAERHGVDAQGERQANYYVQESVGIACGMLITALHHAGLATLTHTPSPMAFLGELLERPSRERAVMLVVAGHPAAGAQVPVITKKPLHEIATFR
ncbi:MAG TPA: nitroreductase family protein [Gemmatimonadales bacterium]|nr:nitroreductase family protein [Gemmatimonadales bacterium]HRX17721.1 nitroreductase family protein [Gemmatimonadales bacterium]